MSLAVNKKSLTETTALAPVASPLPYGMRQMQAAPEAIREDTENDVLIIPLVALREGVFQGATSAAPELYLAEQFGRIADTWNDRMVTIGHPRVNGRFVSAGTTGIWEQDGIGRIQNARVQDKKLKVEAHIDMAKVSELGSDAIDLVERIRRGEQIDVSVGAFVSSEPQTGFFDGKSFSAVQTNYVPDHVAILPVGVKGACSWRDGCGAPRVNAAACACGGAGACSCGDQPEMPTDHAAVSAFRAFLDQLMPDGSAAVDPALADAQLGDRTKRDMLNTALATKETGFFFIIQVFDDHVVYRDNTEKTLRRDFSIDEASGTVTLSDETTEGTLVSEFMPITVQEETNMERQLAVSQLIAAQDTTWEEGDRTFLMGVDDGQFAKLTAKAQPAAPAISGGAEVISAGGEPAASTEVPATVPAVASAETPAVPAQPAAAPLTVQSYIDAAPEPIREYLGEGLARLEEHRNRLIESLTANQRCPFTEAQLKEKRTDELRGLVELAGQAPVGSSYAAQAPISANAVGVPAAYKKLPDAPAWPTAPK